eukprot:scaffold26650_cov63-Phaeocystis_antarctica.AAC.5
MHIRHRVAARPRRRVAFVASPSAASLEPGGAVSSGAQAYAVRLIPPDAKFRWALGASRVAAQCTGRLARVPPVHGNGAPAAPPAAHHGGGGPRLALRHRRRPLPPGQRLDLRAATRAPRASHGGAARSDARVEWRAPPDRRGRACRVHRRRPGRARTVR